MWRSRERKNKGKPREEGGKEGREGWREVYRRKGERELGGKEKREVRYPYSRYIRGITFNFRWYNSLI